MPLSPSLATLHGPMISSSRMLLTRSALHTTRQACAVSPSMRKMVRFASSSPSSQAGGPSPIRKAPTSMHFKDTPKHTPVRTSRPEEDWALFHPVYTPEEVKQVKVVQYEAKDFSDKIALAMVKLMRFGFDLVTGYRHPAPEKALEVAKKKGKDKLSLAEMREARLVMTPEQWLARILFLESIAGVPGMVAAMLRHFKSLRMSGRDGGWIHMLLEEAENERMHLLTFMKIRQPGWFFRTMVFGAQGVFANLFFLAYVVSPRSAHRFVGNLECEAVYTYTLAIESLEAGHLPEWNEMPAPNIAKDYWRLHSEAKMIDVLYAVRADESNHRFVNHSFANLGAASMNPFGLHEPDAVIKGTKVGFTKDESEAWAAKIKEEMQKGRQKTQDLEGI